jgi:hypothetical protein
VFCFFPTIFEVRGESSRPPVQGSSLLVKCFAFSLSWFHYINPSDRESKRERETDRVRERERTAVVHDTVLYVDSMLVVVTLYTLHIRDASITDLSACR